MQQVNLFGYEVFADGTILKLNGQPMKYNKIIEVIWKNKERKMVSYARFVYYAFHRDFDFNDRTFCVKHKDNEPTNNSIDNLYVSNTKEYLRGEKNKKSKLTDKEVKEIRVLYYKYKDNGGELNNPFPKVSYRKLAEKYGVSHSLIRNVIKGFSRKGVS